MISITILTKNSERRLVEVLDALKKFPEIILLDTGSTDNTIKIAETFSNVKIFKSNFTGFGKAHNLATSYASHDWILSVDSDEVVSTELAEEILNTSLKKAYVYSLPFHNYYNKKLIKWCGWYPESHVRLYNRKETRFSEAYVHEGVITQGYKIGSFHHPIRHFPYGNVHDFLVKMDRYSELFAEQYQGRRRSSPLIAVLHGFSAFFKSFFLKRGFMGGYEGFLISAYNGHTALYKYLKLYEKNKKSPPCSSR